MPSKVRTLILKYPQSTLVFIISLVYLYFMQDMFLPTTGDQKTYISQALEMHRDGHWFMQTLFDKSDYYKGPLHFILMRIGFFLFGSHAIFATLYMNFFGLVLLSLVLYKFLLHALSDKEWAFFYSLSVVLSIGVYSHSFASQMEVELVVAYGLVLYFLDKSDRDKRVLTQLLLWGVIGVAGLLKSPAYSIFLSVSVILYWYLSAQLRERVRSTLTWWTFLFGVSVGVTGYLPILLFDGDSFIANYIIRESLSKGANGVPWTTAFFPIFTYFLAPWMFVAIFSYAVAIVRTLLQKTALLSKEERRLIKLGFSIAMPTVLFFTFHPYRGDIYALPVVSATMLMAYIFFRVYINTYEKIYIWMMRLSALVLSLVPLLIVALFIHFSVMPVWWSPLLFPLAFFTLFFTPWFVFQESTRVLKESPLLLSLSFIPLLLTLGLTLQTFGKAEMIGLKTYIEKHPNSKIGDYNLYQNYWNEYGALNFWVSHDVVGLHTKEKLLSFLKNGGSVIVEGNGRKEEFFENLSGLFTSKDFDIFIWKRWLTHGKGPNGESMFLKYWHTKNIKDIQRNFYIFRLKKSKS